MLLYNDLLLFGELERSSEYVNYVEETVLVINVLETKTSFSFHIVVSKNTVGMIPVVIVNLLDSSYPEKFSGHYWMIM